MNVYHAQPRETWFCIRELQPFGATYRYDTKKSTVMYEREGPIVLDFIDNPVIADRLAFQATVRGMI